MARLALSPSTLAVSAGMPTVRERNVSGAVVPPAVVSSLPTLEHAPEARAKTMTSTIDRTRMGNPWP